MKTHEVTNQAPQRVGVNEYESNVALRGAVSRYNAEWAEAGLQRTGEYVGTAEFQADARRANRHEPELQTHDRYGNRIDEVVYDPAYHRIIGAAIADGA